MPPTTREKAAKASAMRDAFAELLAEEVSINAASKRLGVSRQYGGKMLSLIRLGLGDQAK